VSPKFHIFINMVNIYNLFKFLEKQEDTKIPFKTKLIYAPDTLTPDDLKVGGYLHLSNTPITSLPDGLKVGGNLYLRNTPITSLPDGLKVRGSLHLSNTPLSKKYTEEEIRKMIEDKGGNIQGKIYI
jgi:hypothetical protein